MLVVLNVFGPVFCFSLPLSFPVLSLSISVVVYKLCPFVLSCGLARLSVPFSLSRCHCVSFLTFLSNYPFSFLKTIVKGGPLRFGPLT